MILRMPPLPHAQITVAWSITATENSGPEFYYAPQGRLFPREAMLIAVLSEFDAPDLAPLWAEDETIGWIYQYFNSKEERRAMRAASVAAASAVWLPR